MLNTLPWACILICLTTLSEGIQALLITTVPIQAAEFQSGLTITIRPSSHLRFAKWIKPMLKQSTRLIAPEPMNYPVIDSTVAAVPLWRHRHFASCWPSRCHAFNYYYQGNKFMNGYADSIWPKNLSLREALHANLLRQF